MKIGEIWVCIKEFNYDKIEPSVFVHVGDKVKIEDFVSTHGLVRADYDYMIIIHHFETEKNLVIKSSILFKHFTRLEIQDEDRRNLGTHKRKNQGF